MTERIRVDLGARGYDVVVGAGVIANLALVLEGRRRVAIVTQATIPHAGRVRTVLDEAGIAHETFLMGDGEEAKTIETVERLGREFAAWGLLRNDAVVALGGGVVGDTAGFAASVYYRGVDVVQVPTTLLAMVDAAIGGKTGVNLPEGKNLVGAFHQPLAVLADPAALDTLPDREYRCGLGEVAKYALLDAELAKLVLDKGDALLARDPGVSKKVIARCAAYKAHVVETDEFEQTGVRAVLNYGHTLAHAIEIASAHTLLHGEAVAVGLMFVAHLTAALERMPFGVVRIHEDILRSLELPMQAPPGLQASELLDIMARDKKASGGLTFVLNGPNGMERVDDPDPAAIGKAFAAIGVEA